MAKSSGLSEPSLVTFVLTGLKPVLRSRWTVGLAVNWSFLPSGTGAESDSKHGEVIASTYAEISIRAGDLSLKELKDIYHSIKRGLTAQKGLNKGHLELHRLVCQRGGMTAGKGAVAFWKSIMQEWNSTHGKKAQYRTWNGPRIAYGRLLKKLSAYGPSNLSDLNQWIDGTLTPEKSK